MISATGGGGGTDWASLRVDQMWEMLASHDSSAYARLSGGWRRSHELVLSHISQVRAYRANLVAAWPPEGSAAAAAYFARLDALIANLEETHEAAIANHRAFTGASSAIEAARREMAEIHREHAANQALLAAFAEEKRLYQLTPGKARGVPPRRPVPPGRQEGLEARARAVMQALSTELAQAQTALVVPPRYRPAVVGDRFPLPVNAPELSRSRGLSTEAAEPRTSGQHTSDPRASDGRAPQPRASGQRAPEQRASDQGAPGQRGPVAARTGKTAPATARNPASNLPGSPATPSAERAQGVIGRPGPEATASRTTPARQSHPIEPATGIRPVNGIIGATAATGHPDQRTPRVNPIGGVIGRQPAAPRHDDHPRPRRPAHDDPWETDTGVNPVLSPPPETPIDPGPALGSPRNDRQNG
ncbi:hypothetical protein AMIS_74500 [Actinoplanes missouriensis 431]|uniref:PPE family domain-containing protein n=1 Tax=Actinoplanes missouriensis (strain ATCC 14538 / DSM 43046 / CBS 188.64 / JCM 3121 / NBRC 102363 / NCIMB 12654 / NRRL B-3342 / UNCC 431) TaxID=512565 RepID=I0HI33_ACTM4|nr:hypothetical protein [Actinoplanes missouriensis]BAL92670.1 hypothetical protein AMIS_74500 [Actinoplanes missouriensis 431]